MKLFVLGGGPAGLAAAHAVAQQDGREFVLIERGEALGGLARTAEWPGIGRHDLGPHKIFTLDAALMARVEALLRPDEWLTRVKVSSIFMGGHFLPYPPSPFALIKVFGLATFLKISAGYGWTRACALLGGRGSPQTFEDDLEARVGRGLYEALFKPIALKLWGDPKRLDVKLSQGRVQTPSLTEVLMRLLKLRKSSAFEALTFRYPKGGLQRLWNSIRSRCEGRGRFLLGRTVVGLEVADGRVRALRCRDAQGVESSQEVGPDDFVASTLPLGLLPDLMPQALSPAAARACKEFVVLNDLLLVFLHIDKPSLLRESQVVIV